MAAQAAALRMRTLLALLLLASPFAGATPPEPPPERFLVEVIDSPPAGEWGEIRASFWHAYGAAASADLALTVPPWLALSEPAEWTARAPEGGTATRTWLVRPTREGLWSASLGRGPVAIAWAAADAGGVYDDMPPVLDVARRAELLASGDVRVTVEARPSGAWVRGSLQAGLWRVGADSNGSREVVDAEIAQGALLSLVLTPNATGHVSVQDSIDPILRFDGPSGDTPYRLQSESFSRTYQVVDGEVREVDSFSTILEGQPVRDGDEATSERPIPAFPVGIVIVALAGPALARARRSTREGP